MKRTGPYTGTDVEIIEDIRKDFADRKGSGDIVNFLIEHIDKLKKEKAVMKAVALACSFSLATPAYGLAPPPINFKEERFEIDGEEVIVGWDGAKLSVEYGKPKYDAKPVNEGPPPPNWPFNYGGDNHDDPDGTWFFTGCLIAMVFGGAFWYGVWKIIEYLMTAN